jgi:hypothetical protein
MNPFDLIDVTESGEFISYKTGISIPYEDLEELYESGIEFTRKAEIELRKESGEFIKEQCIV